ncbi:hypothetical protein ACFYZ0_18255 [Streptomyces sp. NPDC001708]|uniref:hypothetical protein n=1 Tax=Streptomyces sp. NPDC001708 TaxID=3364602 RepID=UPI00367F6609
MSTLNAAEWNARYPMGTPVVAYPHFRPGQQPAGWPEGPRLETTTRSGAWTLGHGDPVVLVEGETGGISLANVDPVAVATTGGEGRD